VTRRSTGLDYSSTPLGASGIESTFATVRLRQRVTKRLGSRVPCVTLIASFAALWASVSFRRGSLKISGVDLSTSRLAIRLMV
jgi:hypothetical protein